MDLTSGVKTKQCNMYVLAGRTQNMNLSAIYGFSICLKIQNKSHLRQNYSHTGTTHMQAHKRKTEKSMRDHEIPMLFHLQSSLRILFEYYLLP